MKDAWNEGHIIQNEEQLDDIYEHHGEAYVLGQIKRDEIAETVWENRQN